MHRPKTGTDAFYDTVKKSKLIFYRVTSKSANSNKGKQMEAATKGYLELFSPLYISCQSRGADLANSLSDWGWGKTMSSVHFRHSF